MCLSKQASVSSLQLNKRRRKILKDFLLFLLRMLVRAVF